MSDYCMCGYRYILLMLIPFMNSNIIKNNMYKYLTIIMLSFLTLSSCGDKSEASVKEATTATTINKQIQNGSAIPATKSVNSGGIQWNSIDDLEKLTANSDKKVLIDVYTTWCGWCKVMDKQTFTNPEVVDYLNANFHVVKFNAEQKADIQLKGKTYKWVNSGRRGVNMLAHELLNGRLGYPSLVYLDGNLNKIRSSPGFKKPDQLLAELRGLESI